MILTFTIPGVPQQQGSKNPYGGDANKKLKPWRAVAINAAITALDDLSSLAPRPLFSTPVAVAARCYFPRPRSHYGTGRNAGFVKENAPNWMSSAPDLDKLLRAIGDVLTQSAVIQDDRLIVRWEAMKRYRAVPAVDLIIADADLVIDTPEPDEYHVDPDAAEKYR